MWVDNEEVQSRLKRLGRARTGDPGTQEDLFQVALLHLWRLEREQPDRTVDWYVTGCSFHMRDWLREGRSVDSLKRQCLGCPLKNVVEDGDCVLDGGLICEGDPFQEASLADLLAGLKERLRPAEQEVLDLLEKGYGECELAARMRVSHTMVMKWRKVIANAARKLGVERETARTLRQFAAQPFRDQTTDGCVG